MEEDPRVTDEPIHYVVARCCRPWPIAIGYPVRNCGLCGKLPVYTSENPDQVFPWTGASTGPGTHQIGEKE